MEKQVIEILENILDKASGTIELDDEFRQYEEWDSLAYLSVIAEIDDEYGLVIPTEDFRRLKTIEDIVKYLDSRMEQ